MPVIGRISVGDGATFTPAIDSDGVLTFTNNKNLPNPEPFDIPNKVLELGTGVLGLAPINSPAFTGTPTAPTQAKTDNSAKLATTSYVKAVAADYLALTGGSVTGDIDITGDLSVSGTITGNVNGSASENLPLSGGTMTGAITLSDGGNPLSTAGGTMTGAIKGNPLTLTADDGNGNSADLVLNADGSATLDGNNVITSALTGNVLSAYGEATSVNTDATLCSISTHDAGVWLVIGFVDLSYSGTNSFYSNILEHSGYSRGVRNTPSAGGGSCNMWILTLAQNEVMILKGYQQQSGTMRGTLQMVRLA